jgi:MFS transporter, putative metabolite:H+ symporter
MTSSDTAWTNVGARLDRIPPGKFHRRMLALIGGGMFLDGFELYMAGGVMAALIATGFSTLEQNANFVSATFLGMLIGAWSSGVLGDRFGRRLTYQFNLLVFGLASVAAFVTPNIQVLVGLRFIMGLGLGAEVVCSFAMLSEFVPPQARGRAVGWLALLTNGPLLITGFMNVWIIPLLGWRYMFLIGGVGALIVWYLRKSMPESPRWLESKGRFEEADATVAKIEAEEGIVGQPLPAGAEQLRVKRGEEANPVSVWVLFSGPVIGRTLLGMYLHTVVNFCFYGFIGWLPSLLYKQGATITTSLVWTTVMAIGAPTGALIGLSLSDRVGRKPGIIGACVVAVVFGIAMPFFLTEEYKLMAIGFCLFTAIYVLHAVGYALYVPEMFPTQYRLRGMGVCSSAARLATAAAQYGIVPLFAVAGIMGIVGTLSGLLLLLAVWVAVFGIETKNRSLEEIPLRGVPKEGTPTAVVAPVAANTLQQAGHTR